MGQVLSVSELEKVYEVRKTIFSFQKQEIKAVNKVSFDLENGKTLGIVGESGSGKSTLIRCLLMLERPDGGKAHFLSQDMMTMGESELKNLRKKIQVIFQDPYSSLNPRKKVVEAIGEPLLVHKMVNKYTVGKKVMEILRDVGLNEDFLFKYPHEMSGGQRQRVAIGRALSTNPALLIADEPVSSLDVSIQAQIINLFSEIKKQQAISMIFVSHDLNVVRYISDEIMVMYKGKVLEIGQKNEVFLSPLHPYTKLLIKAAQGVSYSMTDGGKQYSADDTCAYYHRCEQKNETCDKMVPALAGTKHHAVACLNIVN